MLKSALVFIVFFFGLLFVWVKGLLYPNNEQFVSHVNLALRRTAHLLLKNSGDSTSRIAPAQHTDNQNFSISFSQKFDYDALPKILDESLKIQGINQSYNVLILDCTTKVLELGYNSFDYNKNEIACVGRSQAPKCYVINLSFDAPPSAINSGLGILAFVLGFAMLGFVYWQKNKVLPNTTPKTEAPDQGVLFGNSRLDFDNLLLYCADNQHTLTYREAKLLRLFVNHQNQLLERDLIMKSVWEDEGIIVGRSLDVFVSRLRKMLQADASIEIVTVHGVGYKLQTP
jgi:Transcriptional regulatory protein, C terminal